MTESALVAAVRSVYDELHVAGAPYPTHPFVGSAFVEPTAATVRIMAVGINAYVDPRDEAITLPAAFAEWFRTGRYRYQRRLAKELLTLATGLVEKHRLGSMALAGKESLYVTNAIKTYVPTAHGKRADQIENRAYDQHFPTWLRELELLAEHDAFPDVMVIVGAPFWGRALATFGASGEVRGVEVLERMPFSGAARGYGSEIGLRVRGAERPLLMIRLRHPAARTRLGGPEWLLEHAGIRMTAKSAT